MSYDVKSAWNRSSLGLLFTTITVLFLALQRHLLFSFLPLRRYFLESLESPTELCPRTHLCGEQFLRRRFSRCLRSVARQKVDGCCGVRYEPHHTRPAVSCRLEMWCRRTVCRWRRPWRCGLRSENRNDSSCQQWRMNLWRPEGTGTLTQRPLGSHACLQRIHIHIHM